MTQCKVDIPDIIKGYNEYFQTKLWAPLPPGPGVPSNANWFQGKVLAIKKSFAGYPTVLAALPPEAGPPKPSVLDETQIKNAKQLENALVLALAALPAWIESVTTVA